ncbi:hypothetical protein BHE74_00024177 [Ensete ventricosum]|nr:hypothetical protein BHE74_00024177 [Ensete ventricosum]
MIEVFLSPCGRRRYLPSETEGMVANEDLFSETFTGVARLVSCTQPFNGHRCLGQLAHTLCEALGVPLCYVSHAVISRVPKRQMRCGVVLRNPRRPVRCGIVLCDPRWLVLPNHGWLIWYDVAQLIF